ncbi:MAG: DUF4920 domain-containing protein [Xanthomonadales bacterium]|nr:DUF4920 domain-containing protein [Xanthomonadales bacterium]
MSSLALTCLLGSALLAGALFGEPMPEGEAVPIGAALAAPAAHAGPAKYRGRIARVCQTKGCWMVLEEDGRWARVMTRHRFFLPKDAAGTAVVFGELAEVEVDPKQARHLAEEDGGGDPVLREFRIVARSVAIGD